MKNYPKEFWKFTTENKVNFFVSSVFVFAPIIGFILAIITDDDEWISALMAWTFWAGIAYGVLIYSYQEAKKKNKYLNYYAFIKREFVAFVFVLGFLIFLTWALLP